MFEYFIIVRVSSWLVWAGRMPRMCAATLPFFGKRHIMLSFFFCLRGGGGVDEGLEALDKLFGSLVSRVSLEELSQ